MSANVPIVRSVSWPAVIIIILVWAILLAVFAFLFQKHGIFIGAVLFSLLFILLQRLIPSSHNKGMKAIKQQDFKTATEHFKQSVVFFTKYKWVDKYRALTMLSASKMSYREMGLCNIAFCYSQTGQAEKAKALYKEILEEYPDNGIAYYSLNSINTFSNKAD
ncbi:tetratricopeptide repeat protein [Sphingobacterium sp. ML3W]|uniref:tetratricopeptide repeat protein n=1 Tax=Sphingobacterium sp. ML3W TaxID=1538644 RepID=UPI00249BB48D|nr:tetratricopeptide repeat protein [Sphingobacterium sp. ML3W]WFA79502.1 tetratricopeptide repeat protein [Sphingobacterium sp. ML3W]